MQHGIPGVGKAHFLVYSDQTQPYCDNAVDFCKAALAAGFDTATHRTRSDLERTDFWAHHRQVLSSGPRAGHGLWKPFILIEALREIAPDDVVLYHDAGSHPTGALPQMPHFPRELIALAARTQDGFIHGSTGVWRTQEQYTRRDCLIGLDADTPQMHAAPLIAASPLIYFPTPAAIAFLNRWLSLCCDPDLVTDAPDRSETSPLMRGHLGEEAIGSVLAHRHGAAFIDVPPDLLGAARRRFPDLRTPEAHVAVLSWLARKVDDPAALVRDLHEVAEPTPAVERVPADVLRDELLWIARRGQGRICTDHLRVILAENRIIGARLHGLKDADGARAFWRDAAAHANRRLAEMVIEGAPPSPPGLEALLLDAVHDTLSEDPDLDEELGGALVWSRLDERGRDAFKVAHGNVKGPAGAAAMTKFLHFLRDRNFPSRELEQSGELAAFDAQLRRHLMDWLLLDHL
ncbi:hypothetical protein [Paracoccus rhizosphaerae]|uniref:Uncharacterized protein n=1 Tax=Paracoccus rhizosphaerae TaxID=1133347 RepID=A0ABV6CPC9_9RHOB|nr:hypothetical protein [Paracoccus rhizosphaerae]